MGICGFCWIRPVSLHAFTIPNITHASVSISFLRISSAIAPSVANNRTKPKSEPLFNHGLHTGDTACQMQRSETACSVLMFLSSMAHAILFAEVSLPASWERWEGCLPRAMLNFPETTKRRECHFVSRNYYFTYVHVMLYSSDYILHAWGVYV